MKRYVPVYGYITDITDFYTGSSAPSGCYKLFTVRIDKTNINNFVVAPCTYIYDNTTLKIGDFVVAFYDSNAPTPLIYPPQYRALAMAKGTDRGNVTYDYFDNTLTSSDGSLKLNISPDTVILMENNQTFTGRLENRILMVEYLFSTKSIPAQTTPAKIIVICNNEC